MERGLSIPAFSVLYITFLTHGAAHRFNPSRHVNSESLLFRFEKPARENTSYEITSHSQVNRIYRCRMDPYQHLILSGNRYFYLSQFKDIGCSVSCVSNGFH